MENKIKNGFKWTTIERFTIQSVQFLLGIIIARLISPSEYGILGILMVFINISQVFIDSGLASALIYKNKLDSIYLNTAFTFNIFISIFLCIVIFMAAPYIEHFYDLPNLTIYIRVSSIALLVNSCIEVPTAILKIKLDFKSLAISNISATITSGIIGVVMAYCGFGIWALIGQLLSRTAILSIAIYAQCHWMPRLMFEKKVFQALYKYGINVFGTGIITKFTDEGISFLIAKNISPYNLGIYTRGTQFANLPYSCLGSVVNTVLFPSLSSIKDDKFKFEQLYRLSVEYQAALTAPFFILFAVISEPVILFLLTDKWAGVIPVVQILCIGKIIALIANISEQVIMASGRSDMFLRQQIYKMATKGICILAVMPFGLMAIVIADAITTMLNFVFTNICVPKDKSFSMGMQIKLISPYLISAVIAGTIGYVCKFTADIGVVQIFIASVSFIVVYYVMVSCVYRKDALNNMIKKVKNKLNNAHGK